MIVLILQAKIFMKGNTIIVDRYMSPCGELWLGALGDKLCLCDWGLRYHVANRLKRHLGAEYKVGASPVIAQAISQLKEYFAGTRRNFDIPLLSAGTDFQKAVWNELLRIPYGETVSYGWVAKSIEMPKAVRAVANANGANAISIFTPCHRVIGSNNSLTGYAGGLHAKEYLLALERHHD